jgi:hypothetical protein
VRMLVSVEFADAGTKTGTHRVLLVGGCSEASGTPSLAQRHLMRTDRHIPAASRITIGKQKSYSETLWR